MLGCCIYAILKEIVVPKERTILVYEFDELSEEAKEHTLDKLRDINVDYDWWDTTYDDAKQIGLEITSFDLYPKNITGKLILELDEVINTILSNHGELCCSYELARRYKEEHTIIKIKERFRIDCDDELEELEKEFLNDLLQEYLSILEKEHEYLISKEAIIETIKANEYGFDEDGDLI